MEYSTERPPIRVSSEEMNGFLERSSGALTLTFLFLFAGLLAISCIVGNYDASNSEIKAGAIVAGITGGVGVIIQTVRLFAPFAFRGPYFGGQVPSGWCGIRSGVVMRPCCRYMPPGSWMLRWPWHTISLHPVGKETLELSFAEMTDPRITGELTISFDDVKTNPSDPDSAPSLEHLYVRQLDLELYGREWIPTLRDVAKKEARIVLGPKSKEPILLADCGNSELVNRKAKELLEAMNDSPELRERGVRATDVKLVLRVAYCSASAQATTTSATDSTLPSQTLATGS